MSRVSTHRRFGVVMWGGVGVALFALVLVAVLRLDPRLAGYVIGALVLFCLAVCILAFWLDARANRASQRLRTGIHDRPPTKEARP